MYDLIVGCEKWRLPIENNCEITVEIETEQAIVKAMTATVIELFPFPTVPRGSRAMSEFPAIVREIHAVIAGANRQEVFSAGQEAARIASAFPASGVAPEDIRQALIRVAILRRIPMEIGAPMAAN